MNQAILKILDDLVVDELKDGTITYNLGYNRAIEDAQDKILDLPSDTQWIDVNEVYKKLDELQERESRSPEPYASLVSLGIKQAKFAVHEMATVNNTNN